MDVDHAYSLIAHAIDTGHAAHGYLVCGDLHGACEVLVERLLRRLFPNQLEQVENKSHPDICYLMPQGKSRTIKVEKTKEDPMPGMRDGLLEPMSTTAFSGGWKVGVIVSADRLQPAAANAFLKLLEEPPPKTLFLLLTDLPDAILPTIVSRTQRIDLPLSDGVLEGDAAEAIAEVFASRGVTGIFAKAQAGKRLAEIFADVKEAAADEDVPVVRKAFFKTLMRFVRQWMVEGLLPRYQAFRNVEAVEEAYRQCERFLSSEMVLSFLTDRLVWPPADA